MNPLLDQIPQDQKEYLLQYLQKANRYKKIGIYHGEPVYSLYQPPLNSPPGLRSLRFRLKRRFEKSRIPAVATIAINKACQCECVHCSASLYNHDPRPEWKKDILKQAFLESIDLGVTHIILLGGEPLLRKDLPELIRAIPAEKSIVTLFTNGEFLTKDRCQELFDSGLMGVFVSLDSPNPETHDTLRKRPGLFSKALEGFENLQKAGLLTAISTYLSPQNLNDNHFQDMMNLGKKMGVHEVTFFDAIPSGRWINEENFLLQPEDRKIITHLVKDYRKKTDYPGISAQSTLTSEGGSAFCFAANTQFYLSALGEMHPCDFTPLSFGRYPDFSIRELWLKMTNTEPYDQRSSACRMQDKCFRDRFLTIT